MSGPLRTFKTRGPRRRAGRLPYGHVTTEQLKRDAERGIEYFWSRRTAALRPPSGGFFDFRHA